MSRPFDFVFDNIVLVILAVGGLLLVGGLLINNARVIQVSGAVLASSIVYLALKKKPDRAAVETQNRLFILLIIVFSVTVLAAFIDYYIEGPYQRSILFLILVSLGAGQIAIGSLYANTNRRQAVLLGAIIVLGVMIRATALYQFPSLVGGDPWTHSRWMNEISQNGYLPSEMGDYRSFPLMHIFGSMIMQITGLDAKSVMVAISACEVAALVFIYLIARHFVDGKIAILAALFVSFASSSVLYGIEVIPQTFALILVPMIIYLVFRMEKEGSNRVLLSLLFLLCFIAIMLAHSLTSFASFVIVVSIWLAYRLRKICVKGDRTVSGNHAPSISLIVLLIVMILAYWVYASGFFGYIVDSIAWAFSLSYQMPSASTLTESPGLTFFKWIPTYLLIFTALIGTYCTIQRKPRIIHIGYGWFVVAFVFTVSFFSLSSLLPGRWFVFTELTLALPAVLGIAFLVRKTSRKAIPMGAIVTIVCLIMISNYSANVTNVNPLTPYPTLALTSSELVAAANVIHMTPNQTRIFADIYYGVYRSDNRTISDGSNILETGRAVSGSLLLRMEIRRNVFESTFGSSGHFNIVDSEPSWKINAILGSQIYASDTVLLILMDPEASRL